MNQLRCISAVCALVSLFSADTARAHNETSACGRVACGKYRLTRAAAFNLLMKGKEQLMA